MKKKLSAVLGCAFSFMCINAVMAEDINQQQVTRERGQMVDAAEVIDPDANLVVLLSSEQDGVKYKALPEEQEQVAAIPGTSSLHKDNGSPKQAPEAEPALAVQPPQVR